MRIAVSNPDNIGDFVVRQPMLAALVAAGHELLLIVRTHVAPLASWAVPGATIVQCVADPYQPQFQLEVSPDDRVISAITAFDPDVFVVGSFQHTQLEEQLAQRLPRAKVIGFGGELFQNDRPRNITHVSAIRFAVQVQVGRDWLESRKNEVLASAILGKSVTLGPPRLTAEKRFLTAAASRLRQEGFSKRKYWIVCAGEGSDYTRLKNWPLEKWAKVCSAMVRDHGVHLIFIGTPAEHESTAAIRAQMGEFAGKTLDMTGSPDGLDMVVGLTASAEGYLGKDTGPMHIAAALGKPVVAVFGGGHWPRFLPSPSSGKVLSVQVPCSDCNWICPYRTSYCVKNIPVEAVQDAIGAVLAGQQPEFEVSLLEPEPWVARAMMLDAAGTAREAMRTLEAERANFHQWHADRVRDIDGLRQDLTRVEAEKQAVARHRDELSQNISALRDSAAQDAAVRQELQQAVAARDAELAKINDHAAAIDSDRMTAQRLLAQRDNELAQLTERAAVDAANAVAQVEGAQKQCAEFSETLARRASEQAELQAQLTALQAEQSASQQRYTALQSEHSALQQQHSALQSEHSALRSEHSALRSEHSALQQQFAALEQQHGNLQHQHGALQQQYTALQQQFAALQQQQAASQQLYTLLQAEHAALQRHYATLQQQHAVIEQQQIALQSRLAARDDEFNRLTAVSTATSGQLESLRAELGTLRNVLDANRALERRFSRFQERTARQLLGYKTRLAALQQHAETAERLEALLPELDALREENKRLDLECSARAASLDASRASLDQVESRYQGAIADLRQQLRRSEEQRRSVLTLVPDLRDELARCLAEVARIPAMEQDQAAKQWRIDQLTQSIDAERIHLESLSAKLAAVEADQTAKQEVIGQLVADLHSASASLEDKQHRLSSAESTIAAIEADREARLRLIERISAELATIEADRADRGRQIDLLHAHIGHQQAKIVQLESTLLPRRLVNLVKKR